MRLSKATFPIGIHMGANNIYAAQLERRGRGYDVRALVHKTLSAEGAAEGAAAQAALREIALDGRFAGKGVAGHLPSKLIFSFPLRFEAGRNESVEQAIVREAGGYLPFPVEEAILDYPSLLPQPGRSNAYKVTVIAVRRTDMDRHLSLFHEAGLRVDAVDFDLSTLIRIHRALHETADEPVVLCNLGDSQSLLSIVAPDGILAHHQVPWGIDNLLAKVVANFEPIEERSKARVLLRQHGLLYERRAEGAEPGEGAEPADGEADTTGLRRMLYQVITPQVEELIYELHKIIGYVRAEMPAAGFEAIYLYGQAPCINYLDHYVQSRLNMRTQLVNPLTTMTVSGQVNMTDPRDGAPFALALGLAMKGVA